MNEQNKKEISFVELIIMLIGVGGISWLLSFIFLGWVGSGAVTLWAKMKGIKLKNPSQDMLLHMGTPLVSFLPLPAVAGQILIIYFMSKADKLPGVGKLAGEKK